MSSDTSPAYNLLKIYFIIIILTDCRLETQILKGFLNYTNQVLIRGKVQDVMYLKFRKISPFQHICHISAIFINTRPWDFLALFPCQVKTVLFCHQIILLDSDAGPAECKLLEQHGGDQGKDIWRPIRTYPIIFQSIGIVVGEVFIP